MRTSPDSFLKTAVDAARAAGECALRFRDSLGPVRYKGEKDLVTEADLECDRLIRARLQAAFPDHDLLTEEGGALDQGSEYRWFVDPIDGTVNYAHGLPLWGVSIGLGRGDELLCGAVYLPVLDELYTAVAGGGAFLNGKPLRVSANANLSQAIVSHGDFNVGPDGERQRLNDENFRVCARLAPAVQRLKCFGSAVAEGAFVAAGRTDAYWMATSYPWDVAAAALLVREAGGRITDGRGGSWKLGTPSVLFSNGVLHPALIATLNGNAPS